MFTKDNRGHFLAFYKPYLKTLCLVLLCALAVTAASLLLPLCIRYITKHVLAGKVSAMRQGILLAGAGMVALVLIQWLCGIYYDRMGHILGAKMERDMRDSLFRQMIRLPLSFFDGEKSGALMSRVTNDLLNLAEFCHHGPENILLYGVSVIVALAVLFHIHVGLALVAALFVPLMLLYTFAFYGKLRSAYSNSYQRIGEMNAMLEDSLSGIRVVKAFAGEGEENARFAHSNAQYFQARKTIYSTEAYFYATIEHLLAPLVTVAVVVTGGLWIWGGSIDLADLLTFLLYIGYLTAPMPKLAFFVQQYQDAAAGFTRYMQVMRTEPEQAMQARESGAERFAGHIAFSQVDFAYRAEYPLVLKQLCLDIPAGQTVAIVGESGVGKSTLCALLQRLYPVDGGQITIDGEDIRGMDLCRLRDNIGVVQQDTYLFAGSVAENIRYGKPSATAQEVEQAARLASAHEFIAQLPNGYDTDIGQRGVRLSGGQRQRLCIARVFLKNPPILIFDEATSALDTETELAVQRSLEVLAKDRTTLIVAHRLSTVRNADTIVVLSREGVAEQGTHEQLMRKDGLYKALYHQGM